MIEDNNIKHYQALAARWAAEENDEFTDADRKDLLGWVRRSMERNGSHDRAELALWMDMLLGLDGHGRALCEAAGWPS